MYCIIIPEMAITPNAIMIAPEIRLTQRNRSMVRKRCPRALVAVLNNHHQAPDPENTPNTNISPSTFDISPLPSPNPAKIAVNDKMVNGFVKVRKSVEA